MKVDSKIYRQMYIWKKLSFEKERINITNKDIENKVWFNQSWISTALKWTKQTSDDKFRKIWKAIWMIDKQLDDLFEEADLEEFIYKHWKWKLYPSSPITDEEIENFIAENYTITKEELAIRKK